MAYTMKVNIANRDNYGNSRSLNSVKYIVIHYTGNDGDHDESNANYFKNNIVKASAHYFVDDDSVTQSVPENYVAWSVGGKKYASCVTTGGGKYYGKCTNTNSISIELCDVTKNGVVYPSEKTIENALALTKDIMKRFGIPKENVIRHFDVNGKGCPAYWCCSKTKNSLWLSEFMDKLDGTVVATPIASNLNPYPEPLITLRKGTNCIGVKWIQWALCNRGYRLVIDGDFGNATLTAVKDFQKKNRLTTDGIVGSMTRNKLK